MRCKYNSIMHDTLQMKRSNLVAFLPAQILIPVGIKHVRITVIITDYKSGDFHLKGHRIEYTSAKIKCCSIEFNIDTMK